MCTVTQANASTRLLFIAALNPTTYNNSATNLDLTVKLSDGSLCATKFAISEYVIDASSAVYDSIWRELAAAGGLAAKDGRLYKLKNMATATGQKYVESNADRFLAAQRSLLTPKPFSGRCDTKGATSTLSLQVATPSVHVLRIDG